jgi:hypothetical protein
MAEKRDKGPGSSERDSGQPGGGQGRVDEVGKSPIYPGSGPYPSGDVEIRTPATLARGQVDEQGRPVEGASEITMTPEGVVLGGATPPPEQPAPGGWIGGTPAGQAVASSSRLPRISAPIGIKGEGSMFSGLPFPREIPARTSGRHPFSVALPCKTEPSRPLSSAPHVTPVAGAE